MLGALGLAEVDDDRSLAPIAHQVQRAHPVDRDADPAGDVADAGPLDLDDLRALIGQQGGGIRTGQGDRQIEDADAAHGSRHSTNSFWVRGRPRARCRPGRSPAGSAKSGTTTLARAAPGVDQQVLGGVVERVGQHLLLGAAGRGRVRRPASAPSAASPRGRAPHRDDRADGAAAESRAPDGSAAAGPAAARPARPGRTASRRSRDRRRARRRRARSSAGR